METTKFRQILDAEIQEIVDKYKDDESIKRHFKQPENQSSYALLIWFLDFYARIFSYRDYITDGDNDNSCDLVFDYNDHLNNRIFYVVQSKWCKNSKETTSSADIKIALSDFNSILKQEKKNINDKLAAKLVELNQHLRNNGEVRFIFFTLSEYKKNSAEEQIAAFIDKNPQIKFEVVDINKIKTDYIDRKYKGIKPINPLDTHLNAEEDVVDLAIVSAEESGHTRIQKPFDAYILLLRPKTIWELFKKYGFSLFFKNVRNPLWQSQFNSEIETTAAENPAYFWYYNNGITAITKFLPKIGHLAERIQLDGGLQIINGAQTAYAIYRAYDKANFSTRKQMDNEMYLTLRLLKSGGRDFDMNVTRYTNSQNPVEDRDFCANDDIQIALQNESFKTNFWYEKRRGEFRNVPEGVQAVSNVEFARAYLAYHLQKPFEATLGDNYFFISNEMNTRGLYEIIFNKKTNFEDVLTAYCIYEMFDYIPNQVPFNSPNYFLSISLSKFVFTKYFADKYGTPPEGVNKKIIERFEKNDWQLFEKVYYYIDNLFELKNELSASDFIEAPKKILQLPLTAADIDNIVLPSE